MVKKMMIFNFFLLTSTLRNVLSRTSFLILQKTIFANKNEMHKMLFSELFFVKIVSHQKRAVDTISKI